MGKIEFKNSNALLFIISVGLALTAIAMSFYIPPYFDEITFKTIASRLFLDGGRIVHWLPHCHNFAFFEYPWFFYPLRWLSSFFYSFMPFEFANRFFGLMTVLLIIVLNGILYYREAKSKNVNDSFISTALFILLLQLGVLFFSLAINRPEQDILLTLSLALVLPFLPRRLNNISLVGIVALWVWSVGLHPKALFILPLVILSVFFLKTKLKWIVIGFLVYTSIHAVYFNKVTDHCEKAPKIQKWKGTIVSPPKEVFSGSYSLIKDRIYNALILKGYSQNLLFNKVYQAWWLPFDLKQIKFSRHLNNIIFYCWRLIIGFIIAFLVISLIRRKMDQKASLILVGMLCLIGTSLLYNSKNFYESTYQFGMLTLLGSWSLASLPTRIKKILLLIILPIVFVQNVQMFLVMDKKKDNQKEAFVSKGEYVYVSEQCGIPLDTPHIALGFSEIVILWDEIILPFKLNDFGEFFGQDIEDVEHFLKSMNSPGVISHCDTFPKKLIELDVFRYRNICCLNLTRTEK